MLMQKVSSFLTISISHNIHLPSDKRHSLADGNSIAIVGVSVPVWYLKGSTNEPAKEVFCNYLIHNHPTIDQRVHFKSDGYEFNIPQLPPDFVLPPEISDEDWMNLDPGERDAVDEERYVPVYGKNLLDVKEGGSGVLTFSVYDRGKIKGVFTKIHHIVRIADITELQNSLIS